MMPKDVKCKCNDMKTTLSYLLIVLFSVGSFLNINAQSNASKHDSKDDNFLDKISSAKKGFNMGGDANFGQDFSGSNFHVGYRITDKFEGNKKAYWTIGADLNWSKYSLYDNSASSLSTTSISFPFIVGYTVKKTFFTGLSFYTGPIYDFIITSRLDRQSYYDIDRGQLAFTVGAKLKFLAIFNTGVAVKLYPTSLFKDGSLNRTSLSFTVGF